MFQDVICESINIDSCWKIQREKSTSEQKTQTSEVLTTDSETQTTGQAEVALQTDVEPRKSFRLADDNSQELIKFLEKVEPMICDQLKRNLETNAFDGYSVQWEEESTVVSCIHTLKDTSTDSEFHCTDLSWNSTGSVLAVAYGKFDHQDWCAHKSFLCTWNLDRYSLDVDKADTTIDVPNCLMCVSCHPELPAVIAGGTFSGEIRVWNTGLTGEPLLASSRLSDLGHKEPVAKMTWIVDQEELRERYLLLSLGNDGKVLVWELVSGREDLRVVKGFRMLTESVPRSIRISKAKGSEEIGGTCVSFSNEDRNLFVVGSENGGVYKCSLLSSSVDIHSTIETDLMSPIKFAFRPHYGPVYGISCSPFHRNLFLSCGTDTTTRLYSLLDPNPILSLEPASGYLFSVCWSVSRPMVFAIGTAQGQVLLYDLKFSHIKPRVSLDASPHKRAIYSLKYNPKRRQMLASGDASGVVKIWRLSTELTVQSGNEMEKLNTIALEALSNVTL